MHILEIPIIQVLKMSVSKVNYNKNYCSQMEFEMKIFESEIFSPETGLKRFMLLFLQN